MDNRQTLADAASAGDAATVRRLLAEEPRLAAEHTDDGWPMIHLAATAEIAGLLIDAGADVNARNRHKVFGPGSSPLNAAVYLDRPDVVQVLLKWGANVNATDNAGWAPLHIAVSNGRFDLARTLLEKGADANARLGDAPGQDWAKKTPLELLTVENRTGEGPSQVPKSTDEQMAALLREHGATDSSPAR